MRKIKRVKISGHEYTMQQILDNHYAESIKKAIVNNPKDLIELFRFLNQEQLKREKAPKNPDECLDRVVYDFLILYEECIKTSISIDRLIYAAEEANYIDFLRYLICNLSDYIESENKAKYIRKIIEIIKKQGTLEQIEDIICCDDKILSQEEMDLLLYDDINFLAKLITGSSNDSHDIKKLVKDFEEKLDKMLAKEDIKGILNFVIVNFKAICDCEKVDFTNSINKIISFILVKGTAKDVYSLARYAYQTPYFRRIVKAVIKTNHWDYWYLITHMFSDDRRSIEENKDVMSDLVEAALQTKVPAYIYFFVAQVKEYLSEDNIKSIIATMIELKDKTYTEYLIMELRLIKLSQNIEEFIQLNYPNMSINAAQNYSSKNQRNRHMGIPAWELEYALLWCAKLECAKECGCVSKDFSFDEIGIAVHEDGSFDNAKQLKLSNIDIGIY